MIEFVYVSPVKGRAVVRYASLNVGPSIEYIGAVRIVDPNTGRGSFEWNEEAIVPIPASEFNKFRREYDREIRDKALIVKTKADYEAWLGAQTRKE